MGDDDRGERGPGCDHHDHEAGFPSPLEDLAIAERAFADGDGKHAAHHLACALAVDPNGAAYLAFAARLLESTSDPLALSEVEGTRYFGMVALRALTHRHLGEHDEAVALLLAVLGTRPDVPFAEWIPLFIPNDDFLRGLDPKRFAQALDDAQRRAEQSAVDVRFRPLAFQTIAELGARACEAFPEVGLIAFVTSRALRAAGQPQAALAVAAREHQREPSYLSAVFLAGAERARGDREAALAAYREALRFDPEDLAVRLDVGDLLLELRQNEAAAKSYEDVLTRDPEHAWAKPSALYAHWLQGGASAARDELESLAHGHARGRSRELADAITPFRGFLPARSESIIASIAAAIERNARIRALHVSSLEAPSAALAVREAARAKWSIDEFSIEADVPDEHDPRICIRPISFPMWTYEGIEATPALPPPTSASVLEEVSALASSRYHGPTWAARAAQRAPRLGAAAMEELLGASLHPPPTPPRVTPWAWRFRVQVASAMLVAFIDEGWLESGRRRGLLSMLLGPLDWVTTAAIAAMTHLAHEEPAARSEIEELFEVMASLPLTPIAWSCAIQPLAHCRLQLPDLDHARVTELRAIRAGLEQED